METTETSRKFNVTRLMRISVLLGLVIFCISFAGDIYVHFFEMPNEDIFPDLSIKLIIGLGITYCAISINKTKYEIKDKTLIVSSFLVKDKIINLSEIREIKQVRACPFFYTKIFFINGCKRNMLPIESRNAFIQIINQKSGDIHDREGGEGHISNNKY